MRKLLGALVVVSSLGCGGLRNVQTAESLPPGGAEFCRQSTGRGFSWYSYVVQDNEQADGTTLVFTDSYPVPDAEASIQVSQAARNVVTVDCRDRTFQGGPVAAGSCADKMLSIVCR